MYLAVLLRSSSLPPKADTCTCRKSIDSHKDGKAQNNYLVSLCLLVKIKAVITFKNFHHHLQSIFLIKHQLSIVMRLLLFCTLIFLWIKSTAQNNEQDTVIKNFFADTTNTAKQNDLRIAPDSSKHFYLVKIEKGFVAVFKNKNTPFLFLNKKFFKPERITLPK